MQLSASIFYFILSPNFCARRIYLYFRKVPPDTKFSPYLEIIKQLGNLHEKSFLNSLPDYIDLSKGTQQERIAATRRELANPKGLPLYHPLLSAELGEVAPGLKLLGESDFILPHQGGWEVLDCKISRKAGEKEHPEILRQIEAYGYLFHKTTSQVPARLSAYLGDGSTVEIEYDGGAKMLDLLGQVMGVARLSQEPLDPVGWTKCGLCSYGYICWDKAILAEDVAIIPDVDGNLAKQLYQEGIYTYRQLTEAFSVETLAEFKKPFGDKWQKVGKRAKRIIQSAKVLMDDEPEWLNPLEIPETDNYVMFDLEGLPPQLDELDKVFLWGMEIYGERRSPYLYSLAGPGNQGDEEGWLKFLELSDKIFAEYGDIPFIHWATYEKTKMNAYIKRFGDRNNTGEKVLNHLVDLLPATKDSVILPLPSYSLKVAEKYVGFKRQLKEGKGDWAMAKFIEATETSDQKAREEIINEILLYNEEDLEATWAVMSWLMREGPV